MTVCAGPLLGDTLNDLFWFFSYRLTLLPLALILPVFLVLGVAVPLCVCRSVEKHTIVERLREAEG